MNNKEFLDLFNLYCKKEEDYKKTYVDEHLQVGDEVEIMLPMLGNGQFGTVIDVRELPKTFWNPNRQDWETKMVIRYVVQIKNKPNQLQFKGCNLKKVA